QTGWDASAFRGVIESSIDAARSVDAVPTWVLGNHDVVRPTTRYGLPEGVDASRWLLDGPHDDLDAELGLRRWRAAVLMMLALPGAAYLYQGEELGLPEVWDLPESVLHDPIWERSGRTEKGRDGCRVPMPWTPDGPSFGFGSNGTWLPQPATFGALSVASQEGTLGSTLEMVRTALDLRRRHGKADETAELIDLGEDVVAFRRPAGLSCVVNMGSRPADLPGATVLLASADVAGGVLQPDDAVWMLEE
ncbi:MAG: alpha-amylase family glycosyl hydrolase, partial [Acidimicrobiia bacterium]|nr:alpha-amylase family glycosyl hydrolase [Acidimicrobiia bacterium]